MNTNTFPHPNSQSKTSGIPSQRNLHLVGLALLFISVSLACNLGSGDTADPDLPSETESSEPITQDTKPSPTDTEAAADTQPDAAYLQVSELDPCKYITQEQAEQVLSDPVTETIPADAETLRSCTFVATPGEKFITISVFQGSEASKLFFLDEIGQLQDDCSITYSYSSDPEPPTPLPPDIQALSSNTLLELFVMDLELQAGCGGSYQALPDIGANVYTYQTFIQGAVIGVASDDIFVTFLYVDVGLDAEQSLEAVKEFVRIALLAE